MATATMQQQAPAPPFDDVTRQKVYQLTNQPQAAGAKVQSRWDIPRAGFLGRIYLQLRGTTAAAVLPAQAIGMCSLIQRVRLITNAGQDLFNMSGAGYWYPYAQSQDMAGVDPSVYTTGRTAWAAGVNPWILDMVIPIAFNLRDAAGLLMVQNDQTLATLTIDWNSEATVFTGGSYTITTAQPIVEFFTVPQNPQSWPRLDMAHQILEETYSIPAAGQYAYTWPRGGIVVQMLHGVLTTPAGFTGAFTDGFTDASLRINQTDYIYNQIAPNGWSQFAAARRGVTRLPGVIPMDLTGSSGLGNYDKIRDEVDTRLVTSVETVVNATAANTLYSIRRQFVPLPTAV